jgi:hypothetical protein
MNEQHSKKSGQGDHSKEIVKRQLGFLTTVSQGSSLLRRGLKELGLVSSEILKLISHGDVKIGALDGSWIFDFSDRTMFRMVFFDEEDLSSEDQGVVRSNETELLVYELVGDANIYQMFASLNSSFDDLCLTQNQILEFLEKYKKYAKGKTNHFLFKSGMNILVAQVCFDSDGSMRLFGGDISEDDKNDWVYSPKSGHFRVIVPK